MFPRGFATPQYYDWNHGRIAKKADDTEMEESSQQLPEPGYEYGDGDGVGVHCVRQYGEMDRTHFSSSSLRYQDRGTARNSLPQDDHGRRRETHRDHQNLSFRQSGRRGGQVWGGREDQGDHTEQMPLNSPHGDRTQHEFDDQWVIQDVPFVAGESWRVPPDVDFLLSEREKESFPARQEKNRGLKRGCGDDRDQNVCEGNAKTARVETEFSDEPFEEFCVDRNYTEESSSNAMYQGRGNEKRERTGDQWNRNNRSPMHSQRDEQRRSQNRDRHWVHQPGGVQRMTEDRTVTGDTYDELMLQELMERSIRDDTLPTTNQTDGRQVGEKAFRNRGEQRKQAGQCSYRDKDQQRRTRLDTKHLHSERDQHRRDWQTGKAGRRSSPRTELKQTAERGWSRNPEQQGLEQLRPPLEQLREEDGMSDMSLCSDEGQGSLLQTTDKLNEDMHHQLKDALNSGTNDQECEKDMNHIHEMAKLSPTQFRSFLTNNTQHLATLAKLHTDHEHEQEHVIGQEEKRQGHRIREQGHKQEHGIREPFLKQDSHLRAESLGKNLPLGNHPPYLRYIEEGPQQRAEPMDQQAPSRNPLQPSRSEVTLQYAPIPIDLAYGRDSFHGAQALSSHSPCEPGPSFEPALVILPPMVYPPFGDVPAFGPHVLVDPPQHSRDPSKAPLLRTPQCRYGPPSPLNTDVGSAETRNREPAFVLLPSVDCPLIGDSSLSVGPHVLADLPQHPKDPSKVPLLQTPQYRYAPPSLQTANVRSVETRHPELDTAEKRDLDTVTACLPSAVSSHQREEKQQRLKDCVTSVKENCSESAKEAESETRQPQPTRPPAKPASHDQHQNSYRPEGRSSSTRQRPQSPSRRRSPAPSRQKSESPASSKPARKRPSRVSVDAAVKKKKSSSSHTSAKRSREQHSPAERTDDNASAEKLTHASTTEPEKKTLGEAEEQMMIRAKQLLQLQQELNRLIKEKEEWLQRHKGQAEGDAAPSLTPAMIENTMRQLEIGLQMKALKEGKTVASVLETETASLKFPSDEKKKREDSREVNCCKRCDQVFYTTHDFVTHLASFGHLQNQRPSNHLWQKAAMKKYHKKDHYPIKGAEMLVATVALYCPLCCELCPDTKLAEAHLRSQQHYDKYQDYVYEHPSYERHYQQDCWDRQNRTTRRNLAASSTRDYHRRRSGSSSASSHRAKDRRTFRKRSTSPDDIIDLTEMSPTHSDDEEPRSRSQPASSDTITASQSANHGALRSQRVSNSACTSRSTNNRGTVLQLPDSRAVVSSDPGLDFEAQLSPVSLDSLVLENDGEPDIADTSFQTAAASKPITASEPASPPSTPTPASKAAKCTPAGPVDTVTAAKPTPASAAAKPTPASAAAKPTPASATNKLTPACATNKPTPASATDKLASASAATKPTPASAAVKSTSSRSDKPTPARTSDKPTTASAANKLASASAATKPTPASAADKPTPTSAAAKPTPASAATKPTSASAAAKPTSASAATKPTHASATNKPTPASATNKPTPASAAAKPTPASATNKPTSASAAAKPTPASATNKPTPASAADKPTPASGTNKPTSASAAAKPTPASAASKQVPVNTSANETCVSATPARTSAKPVAANAAAKQAPASTTAKEAPESATPAAAKSTSASAGAKLTPASAPAKPVTASAAAKQALSTTTLKKTHVKATSSPKQTLAATKMTPTSATSKQAPVSTATKPTSASATSKLTPTSATAASVKTASPSRRSDGTILAGAYEKPLLGEASASPASASVEATPAGADVKSTISASATAASTEATKQKPTSVTAAPRNSSAKTAPDSAADKSAPVSAATKQTRTAAKQPPTSATAAPASVKPAPENDVDEPAADKKQTPASASINPASTTTTTTKIISPASKSKLANRPEVSANSVKPVATTGASKSPATTPTRKTHASKTCKSVPIKRTPKATAAAAAANKTGSSQMAATALPREAASSAVSQEDTTPQPQSELPASDANPLSDSTASSDTAQSAALEAQNPETASVSSTPEPLPPPASTSPTKRQTRSVARHQGSKKGKAGSSSASGSV